MPLFSRASAAFARYPRTGALIAGAAAACGFQPLGLWPLTIVAIALLLEWLTQARTARGAFMLGWCFGLGHFTVGNNWIATAFTYQAQMPSWLGGIAVVLAALYLAIFPALACIGAWTIMRLIGRGSKNPLLDATRFTGLLLAFAGCWIVAEWMRGWLFTGFPWNPLGVALLGGFRSRGLAILTPWIGTYGLSGIFVLLAGLCGYLGRKMKLASVAGRAAWAALGIVFASGIAAAMLLPDHSVGKDEGGIDYTLVQPDIRQERIDDPAYYEANFVRIARLSVPEKPHRRRIVFWPESGLADFLRDGYPPYVYGPTTYAADPDLSRERIGTVIGPYAMLLTGAVDLVMDQGDQVAARNTVTALDSRGAILASYSKAHLVPFGEYLPLRSLLEPLGASRLVAGTLDFWPGPGPRTFDFGAYGQAGIQICYEIVFSGHVVDPHDRPDYIFNPSNDGWFGSWGPPQHLAQARLRAIEEGLPVLRSTTTGISAVIDADGIVRAFVPRHRAGRLDGTIPPAHAPTLFARYGNVLPILLALVLIALSCVALRRREE